MKSMKRPMSAESYDTLRARPPLVVLDVATAGHGTAVPQGVAQSVPGIMSFTVLMMTLIYGAVFLTIEKREGMLKRQLTLPVSRMTILGGKVLGRLFIAIFQIAILVAAGRFLFRLDFGESAAALVAVLLSYAFAVAGIATFLGAVVENPEQASIIGWLSSMVMAAMGGCWWPAEVMPSWLRTAAHVFPTTWAMDAFHALISFGRGLEAVLVPCAALVGFGVLFSWAGARKLRASA
jgi:ABC-type multidrug transport system permease subunit